jgi:hypothetical protein
MKRQKLSQGEPLSGLPAIVLQGPEMAFMAEPQDAFFGEAVEAPSFGTQDMPESSFIEAPRERSRASSEIPDSLVPMPPSATLDSSVPLFAPENVADLAVDTEYSDDWWMFPGCIPGADDDRR